MPPSCLILAALIVIPPWILIATPGVLVSGGGTTGRSQNLLEHGWPAVSARSAEERFTGTWNGKVFTPNVKPSRVLCHSIARKSLNAYQVERETSFLNFRLRPIELDFFDAHDAWYFQSRFWSNKSNWPYLSNADGYAIDWSTLGLITNLAVLALILLAVAVMLQLRRRWTKRVWKPSLGEMLFAVTAVCVIVAVLSAEHRRAVAENQFVSEILNSSNAFAKVQRKTKSNRWIRIPEVATNLLDNRVALPWTETPLYAPVSEILLDVSFETLDSPSLLETENDLIEGLNGLGRPIRIRSEINEQFISFINKLDLGNVMELRVDLEYIDTGIEDGEIPYADKLKNFPLGFSQLQKLCIKLDSYNDQEEQLARFLLIAESNQLPVLMLDDLNKSGVEYLISNVNRLPKEIQCLVSSDEMDSKELEDLAKILSFQLVNDESYWADYF